MSRQDVELLMGKNQEVIPFSSHGRKKTVSNPFKTEIIQAKVFGEEKFHPILRYDYVIGFVETSDSPGCLPLIRGIRYVHDIRVVNMVRIRSSLSPEYRFHQVQLYSWLSCNYIVFVLFLCSYPD